MCYPQQSLPVYTYIHTSGHACILIPSGANTSPVFSVVEAVHAHYVPALMQYGSLERQTLHIALQSLNMVSSSRACLRCRPPCPLTGLTLSMDLLQFTLEGMGMSAWQK